MKKTLLIGALASLCLTSCVTLSEHEDLLAKYEQTSKQYSLTQQELLELKEENAALTRQNQSLNADYGELALAKNAADAYAQSMVDKCKAIGRYGGELIKDGMKLMTHCNAGALATVDVGTALAPMRQAWADGKRFFVYVSETRPRLQGMQLTAWELLQEGIDHAIIPDGSSGHFIRKGVDMIITGADRIAANGDFANKIGTFEKAVLAKEFNVPFYVAAPISTFDFNTKTGDDIVIEDRSEEEVTMVKGVRIAPVGCHALNPSFDMTPARYVTGFITEKGILRPDEIRKVIE